MNLNKFVFEQIYLPIKLLFDRPQLYFSPSIILPYFIYTPSVIVVYDLIFDLFPQFYRGRINSFYLKLFFPRSLRRARAIIAISESTKHDLMRLYNIPEKKITVIHLAAAKEYRIIYDQDALVRVKRKYSLPENYILFVGTVEPRKNVRGLLRAYLSLPGRIREKHSLVICGQKGWGYDSLQRWLVDQPTRNGIIFLDYVEEADLPAVYNMAALFVYPSYYEGFGLPILEAMACGVPTITSSVSSIPEVAGEAAILIDPNNIGVLSDKIKSVLENEQVAGNLKDKGLAQAKKYSWGKTVQQTLELINSNS
ncbi:glycosyltransferase family 4 protein [Candidatus Saganbacteria bacterium]|nr:glycosyltransferase family 4 protein [Candidatus Saganbacteria bacterium]